MLQIFTMPFLVGVLVAAVYIAILRLLDSRLAQWLYAAGLLTAALIYVGFAGLNHGIAHMGLEGAGLLIFGVVSVLGARRWPLLLGLGWLAHGGWDVWHAAHHSPLCALLVACILRGNRLGRGDLSFDLPPTQKAVSYSSRQIFLKS